MAIKILNLSHVAYSTRDMDKTLHFYCEILGFPKAFSLAREGKPWIEYIKVAKLRLLEFFYFGDNSMMPTDTTTYNHISLSVTDIFALEKKLDAAGWPIDTRPKQGRDTNWQMWVKDPDGNRIEFMQIGPDSPQAKA